MLPTREDCFGLVLLEAMCAGVPIVASKYADGAYDTVVEGVNGYIADPFQPEAFGKCIEKAMNIELLQEETISAESTRFTFEEVIKGFLDAIDKVTIQM